MVNGIRPRVVVLGCLLVVGATAMQLASNRKNGSLPTLVSAAGTCSESRLSQLPGLSTERLDKGLGYTFALAAGHRLSLSPGGTERLDVPLIRIERLTIMATAAAEQILLVRTQDGRACGWLQRDDVLIGDRDGVVSLRYGPRAQSGNALGLEEANGLALRAVIAPRSAISVDVAIYDTPNGKVVRRYPRAFQPRLLHIFRTQQMRDGKWYLVGVRDEQTHMIGWLPASAAALPVEAASLVDGMLAFEPAILNQLLSVATTTCEALDGTDPLSIILRDIDGFWPREVRASQATPAGFLSAALGIPASVLPAQLGVPWRELDEVLRHATSERRAEWKRQACQVKTRIAAAYAEALRRTVDKEQVPLGGVPLDIFSPAAPK